MREAFQPGYENPPKAFISRRCYSVGSRRPLIRWVGVDQEFLVRCCHFRHTRISHRLFVVRETAQMASNPELGQGPGTCVSTPGRGRRTTKGTATGRRPDGLGSLPSSPLGVTTSSTDGVGDGRTGPISSPCQQTKGRQSAAFVPHAVDPSSSSPCKLLEGHDADAPFLLFWPFVIHSCPSPTPPTSSVGPYSRNPHPPASPASWGKDAPGGSRVVSSPPRPQQVLALGRLSTSLTPRLARHAWDAPCQSSGALFLSITGKASMTKSPGPRPVRARPTRPMRGRFV